jgi:hypothetical protein
MKFLRSAWYAGGWAAQLNEEPIAITILDLPLMVVCNGDGSPSALTGCLSA